MTNLRYAATETAISPQTVGGLQPQWVFTTGREVSATPAVDGTTVYAPDWAGNLFAVSRATGQQVWKKNLQADYAMAPGDIIRATPAIDGNRLFVGDQGGRGGAGATMLAIDRKTGALLWKTKLDDHPFAVITQSAVVYNETVYVGVASIEEGAALDPSYPCCSFRGSVVALDALTGAIKWRTAVAPNAPGFSGVAVWGSTPVVDTRRGSLYVTTGNNYTLPASVLDCVEAAGEDETAVRGCMTTPGNLFDAVVSLDLASGAIKWSNIVLPFDAWTVSCFGDLFGIPETNCPQPAGPDYDFAQGAMLIQLPKKTNGLTEVLAAGQKSGIMWALNPANGAVVWKTQVGPGGEIGGLQWGSASDGARIYTAISNSRFEAWPLMGGGTAFGGFWSALDSATGARLWDSAGVPGGPAAPFTSAENMGPVTVANGVVFGAATDPAGTFVAMDAETGQRLWSYPTGGSSLSGAAVTDGQVFVGSGYTALQLPWMTGNNKLYAFHLG